MPKIIYVEYGGNRIIADVAEGESVMRGALSNNVRGIDADCGGECSCATCHVLVSEEWMSIVGPPEAHEESMLRLNPEREDNSRLSCQLEVSEVLDGMVVFIPEFQM